MSATSSTSAIKSIFLTGLIAGTLDITAAITILGKMHVAGVLKYIASGAFGMEAFSGGTAMALYGLLFHFTIAYSFTIVYFLVYPHITLLQQQKIVSGLLYGIIVWAVMNLLILPMTNIPKSPFSWSDALKGMIILMFMIGLPISLMTNWYYRRKASERNI